jgi:hypothetical protein
MGSLQHTARHWLEVCKSQGLDGETQWLELDMAKLGFDYRDYRF